MLATLVEEPFDRLGWIYEPKLDGERFGKTDDRPFGRGIGRAVAKAVETGGRRNVDDNARSLRLHDGCGAPRTQEMRVEADGEAIAPPHQLGDRHRNLRTALPSVPMQHIEDERVLTEVEVRLGFDADLISPCVPGIAKESPQAVVPVVDSAADRRENRVSLDARIAERDETPRCHVR